MLISAAAAAAAAAGLSGEGVLEIKCPHKAVTKGELPEAQDYYMPQVTAERYCSVDRPCGLQRRMGNEYIRITKVSPDA
jgi:hypothetical protein